MRLITIDFQDILGRIAYENIILYLKLFMFSEFLVSRRMTGVAFFFRKFLIKSTNELLNININIKQWKYIICIDPYNNLNLQHCPGFHLVISNICHSSLWALTGKGQLLGTYLNVKINLTRKDVYICSHNYNDYLYQSTGWLITGEIDFHPIQSLVHIHFLFHSQYRVDEELLYPLVAVVDTELLKAIIVKVHTCTRT